MLDQLELFPSLEKPYFDPTASDVKTKIAINMSGGRTSAYMLHYMLFEYEHRDKCEYCVVFANTGKEAPGTLEFVKRCSEEWNVPIHWVEYKPTTVKGWGVESNEVTYETAARNGEPFELMISRVGIPTVKSPFCSQILKAYTINAYLKQNFGGDYYIAIGIRADEIDRMNPNFKKLKILYPLIRLRQTSKKFILKWWSGQDFDLEIDPDYGNCDGCWKKDIMRLVRIARKKPEVYDWWQYMTDKYGDFNPRNIGLRPPFNFYRGNISPRDIFVLSKMPDRAIVKMAKREKLDGCSESCEPF